MILGHDIFATTNFANTENGLVQAIRWFEICPQVTAWGAIPGQPYTGAEIAKITSSWNEIPKNNIGVTKCR